MLRIGSIVWGVRDVARAIQFWCEALNYRPLREPSGDWAILAALCGRPRKWKALFCSARTCSAAPRVSAVSPVRSPLAARPPGVLRHSRAVPARHRVLRPSRCLRDWRAGCPATPESGPAGPPASAPRQPTVAVDCADRQGRRYRTITDGCVGAAAVALRRALYAADRSAGVAARSPRGGGPGIGAWISRDASRVQSMGNARRADRSLSRGRTEMAELYCYRSTFGFLLDR